MRYVNMTFLWPLVVFCTLCTLSPDVIETASPPWELPEWGLLITTTKTVLFREGVVLRTRDPALDKTFHRNFLGSPPKCSTPRRESPPKFESPLDTSSCDDSAQSVRSGSSISSIVNGSFGPAYKKRKIRQKVEAAMGSIETVCMVQGETLGDVIAQSCLFQRKKTFSGKELICQVFSEVARELAVRKAFNELIPEELWS